MNLYLIRTNEYSYKLYVMADSIEDAISKVQPFLKKESSELKNHAIAVGLDPDLVGDIEIKSIDLLTNKVIN